MRKSLAGIGAFLLCASLLLLSGCFDVTEEIRVRSDLSGRYTVKLSLPENLANMGEMMPGRKGAGDPQRNFEELKAKLEKESFIESADVTAVSEGDMRSYNLDIQARDMRRLGEYFEEQLQGKAENPFGLAFKLERQGLAKFRFTRQLKFSGMGGLGGGGDAGARNPCAPPESDADSPEQPAAPESGSAAEGGEVQSLQDKMLDEGRKVLDKGIEQGRSALGGLGEMLGGVMGGALMGDHYYTLRFYAPGIDNTDGTILDSEKAVEWSVPMGELLSGQAAGRSFSADFTALGISRNMMIILALGTMFIVGGLMIGIAVSIGRRRKRAGSGDGSPA